MSIQSKGIDISEYNGNFNIQSAINQGATFVIIRCGYGMDLVSQDDKYFSANVAKCEASGVPYGIYLYSYANNTTNASSEANHALRLAKTCNPTCGVWFDAEDPKMPSSASLLAQVCNVFCDAVQKAGYYTGIYASASWMKHRLTDNSLKKWPKWVAHFTTESKPDYFEDDVVMWQYSCPPGDVATPTDYDWNTSYVDFWKGGNRLSRVLKTGDNQVTQGYSVGKHDGIDIVKKTDQLDYIMAHSEGTVSYVQTGYGTLVGSSGNASYGNLVKIKHPNGQYTLYAHLSKVDVKVGDKVVKGQTIGYMGNTGNSYGAHLHFELRNSFDIRIDPTPYINKDLIGLETEDTLMSKEYNELKALIEKNQKINESNHQSVLNTLADMRKEYTPKKYDNIDEVPDWYKKEVAWCIDNGIIKGTSPTSLGLTNDRCAVATMIYRACHLSESKNK